MAEISPRFAERSDSIEARGLTTPQPDQLREDEPHPVRTLRAAPDFGEHGRVDRCLRLDKPLERVSFVHTSSLPRYSSAAIILFNCRYLIRVATRLNLRDQAQKVGIEQLSPLGWDHINLTGDYVWTDPGAFDDDGFLRPAAQDTGYRNTADPAAHYRESVSE